MRHGDTGKKVEPKPKTATGSRTEIKSTKDVK